MLISCGLPFKIIKNGKGKFNICRVKKLIRNKMESYSSCGYIVKVTRIISIKKKRRSAGVGRLKKGIW